jgi:uncharacterized membrane protein YjgN (DUF898 family)
MGGDRHIMFNLAEILCTTIKSMLCDDPWCSFLLPSLSFGNTRQHDSFQFRRSVPVGLRFGFNSRSVDFRVVVVVAAAAAAAAAKAGNGDNNNNNNNNSRVVVVMVLLLLLCRQS